MKGSAKLQDAGDVNNPCVGVSSWKTADENHSEGGFDQSYKFHKDS
jgi:hypothetical protein